MFLARSQLDSKMVVSGSQIPSKTGARAPQTVSHSLYIGLICTLVTVDQAPISRSHASLTLTVPNHLSKQSYGFIGSVVPPSRLLIGNPR